MITFIFILTILNYITLGISALMVLITTLTYLLKKGPTKGPDVGVLLLLIISPLTLSVALSLLILAVRL